MPLTLFRVFTALGFIAAGVLHFMKPASFITIIPRFLPAPGLLVVLSGAAEIAGGIGLLVPALRLAAGWGLLLLLIAVFPANIHMAVYAERFPNIPAWTLWLRLPMQPGMMWIVWKVAGLKVS